MELEEIWSLTVDELREYRKLPENISIDQARIKVVDSLYLQNKLDLKQRFIVENEMFPEIGNLSIYEAYKKMKIKFNMNYVKSCSQDQLLDFIDISKNKNIVGSDAHITAIIIKLIKDELFDDENLLKTKQFTAPIIFIEKNKEEIKTLGDWALYLWPKSVPFDEKVLKKIEKELSLCDKDEIPSLSESVKNVFLSFPKPAKTYFKDNIQFIRKLPINIRDDILKILKFLKKSQQSYNLSYMSIYQSIYVDRGNKFLISPESLKYLIETFYNSLHDANFVDLLLIFMIDINWKRCFEFALIENNNFEDCIDFFQEFNKYKDLEKSLEIYFLYIDKFDQDGNGLIRVINMVNKLDIDDIKKIFCYASNLLFLGFYNYTINIVEDTFMCLSTMFFKLRGLPHSNDFYFHNRELDLSHTKIGEGEIEKRVARALLSLTKNKDAQVELKCEYMLKILSADLNNNINYLLINTIYRQQPTRQTHVDVHSFDRDKKTKKAISLLIEEPITKKEVNVNFEEFWQARNNLSTEQKNALLRVLGVDDNFREGNRIQGDFGGLLSGNVTFYGINIDPKELIARFWKFASNKEYEKENLKLSVQLALIDSLQNDGKNKNHVVCNPGKIQRLAVSILQGRLKDEKGKYIDIDGYLNNEDEDKNVNKEYIETYTAIEHYFNNFMSQIFSIEETRPKTVDQLITEILKYIQNLKDGFVPGYGRVYLNPGYVMFYFTMIFVGKNGYQVDPELSIASNYEDMFSVKEFV